MGCSNPMQTPMLARALAVESQLAFSMFPGEENINAARTDSTRFIKTETRAYLLPVPYTLIPYEAATLANNSSEEWLFIHFILFKPIETPTHQQGAKFPCANSILLKPNSPRILPTYIHTINSKVATK